MFPRQCSRFSRLVSRLAVSRSKCSPVSRYPYYSVHNVPLYFVQDTDVLGLYLLPNYLEWIFINIHF